MAKKPRKSAREQRKEAYLTGKEKKLGLRPIPASMKGPSKGKNGVGRPRTGNLATTMDAITGTELGKSHAHLDHAYNRFLEGVDEQELQTALAANTDRRCQNALLMLTHPTFIRQTGRNETHKGHPGEWSIGAVLKHAGITLPHLMDLYGRYRTAQAVRVAMDRAPRIMQHTADDAENRMIVCARCDGFGTLDLDQGEETPKRRKALIRTCPECEGEGKVNQSGCNEARKLVFEVAGIAGKKAPMVDARSVNVNHGAFSVENMVKEMEAGEGEEKLIAAAPVSGEIIDVEEVTE